MMKINRLQHFLWMIIAIVVQVFAQSNSIDIHFVPPKPEPGSPLKLNVTLYSNQPQLAEIEILLFTYTDLNSDCKYTELGEINSYFLGPIVDNQKGEDEVLQLNEFRIEIFKVPERFPPQRYVARVKFGNLFKTETLNVLNEECLACSSESWSIYQTFKSLLDLPCVFVKKLRTVINATKRANEQEEYQGEHGLFIYDVHKNRLFNVIYYPNLSFLFPQWSHNNTKIVFVVKERGNFRIAWLQIDDNKEFNFLTEAGNNRDPFWLPNNMHVVFLCDQQIKTVNTITKEIATIDSKLQIDRIVAVVKGIDGYVGIFVYSEKSVETYLLELNDKLELKGPPVLLVHDPILFSFSHISPQGDKVAFIEADSLYITSTQNNNAPVVIDTGYRYYEPRWSLNGKYIVFVSNREHK